MANSAEVDQTAFDILDRTDWQDYLPSYAASQRTLALLRNDAVHTLNLTTYPAKVRQAESAQREGLQLVTGLWVVFVVIGLLCLIAICAYELSSSLVFADLSHRSCC